MALPRVGSQLIVFGKKYNIENDIEAILDSLQKAGYAAVEGGPQDAARYRPMLDARGMVYAGSHMAISGNPDIDQLIEYSRIMGSSDISNSGLVKWGDVTLDDYQQSIKLLNEAGRKLRDAGIHLHYHNHAFEFDKVDGSKNGMDILLDGPRPGRGGSLHRRSVGAKRRRKPGRVSAKAQRAHRLLAFQRFR
jgi:sugar phosphate isomerase/epimerase